MLMTLLLLVMAISGGLYLGTILYVACAPMDFHQGTVQIKAICLRDVFKTFSA